MAVEAIRHMFYPVPHDLNFSELAVIQAHVLNYPLGAFLFVIAGWIFATFSGGMSADAVGSKARTSGRDHYRGNRSDRNACQYHHHSTSILGFSCWTVWSYCPLHC